MVARDYLLFYKHVEEDLLFGKQNKPMFTLKSEKRKEFFLLPIFDSSANENLTV